MTKRAALNASVTPELAGFVAVQAGSGCDGSAGEVVRTSFGVPEERERPMTAPVLIGAPAPVVRDVG